MSGARKHALLSASSAHRWLVCTPSAKLEEQFPDTESSYAKEGTLAHEICELKVSQNFIKKQSPATFKKKLKKLQENELYEREMDGHTEEYLDYVSGLIYSFDAPPYIAVEKRVDFSEFVPEGFGTCDCIVIGGNTMHIVDFKYGKGVPVKAAGNAQLKLYAIGALMAYRMLYPVEEVVMHIVQPRIDNNNQGIISSEDLLRWGEVIKPIAIKAYNGEGVFRPSDETCKFCRVEPCRARAEKNLELAKEEFKMPPLLSNEEVGEILQKAKDIQLWVNNLKEWALKESLAGGIVPGWKAVEGVSRRKFIDIDAAFKIIQASGIADETMLYERKPLTLTAVEKLIGKKDFTALLAEQIVKPPGKPALAPENDKREAITLKTSAEEDFKEE